MISKNQSKRIYFCIGTAGELIKTFPLMLQFAEMGHRVTCLHTGQSGVFFFQQWRSLNLDSIQLISLLKKRRDLTSGAQALVWILKNIFWVFPKLLIAHNHFKAGSLWFVHGDTLSTVLGAVYGRMLLQRVVHLESGLSSEKLFSPFPEELSRKAVMRIVDIAFATDSVGEQRLLSLKRKKLKVFSTHGNTLIDSLKTIIKKSNLSLEEPKKEEVLIHLHRNENLTRMSHWVILRKALIQVSKKYKCFMVLHPQTKERLNNDVELLNELRTSGVVMSERLNYLEFTHKLSRCLFLITDGGSNQEESAYLGVPCLILRGETERLEGLGQNVMLSGLDPKKIDYFLEHHSRYRVILPTEMATPVSRIVETLKTEGLI